MIDGLSNWMDDKGFKTIDEIVGKSLNRIDDFGNFNLLFKTVANINQEKCINCNLCYIACEDTEHQAISLNKENGKTKTEIIEENCVGCDLCSIVCPVEGCITMQRKDSQKVSKTWNELMADMKNRGEELSWENLRKFQHEHGIEIH